jgi:hypothetical protein
VSLFVGVTFLAPFDDFEGECLLIEIQGVVLFPNLFTPDMGERFR